MAQEPELRAEFERLETDAHVAKDALPLITACTASTGEFPAYARERLQTAVQQTLGRPKFAAEEWRRSWHWVLALATATAVVLLVGLLAYHTSTAAVIQLAMLDTGAGTRAADMNEAAVLKKTWKRAPIQTFSSESESQTWEKNWPSRTGQPVARIVYDQLTYAGKNTAAIPR